MSVLMMKKKALAQCQNLMHDQLKRKLQSTINRPLQNLQDDPVELFLPYEAMLSYQ